MVIEIWVPDENHQSGLYKNRWRAIAGDNVLNRMCDFYDLPSCYPLPDGSMGRSNWGNETCAGRICAQVIDNFKDKGYTLDEEKIDGESFENLARRYVYGKKYDGDILIEVSGYDEFANFEFEKAGFKKDCPLANIMVRVEDIKPDNYYAVKPDRLKVFEVEADAINVLKQSAKIFDNKKYIIELGYNSKFEKYKYPRFVSPNEKLVLFGKLKKNRNELGELEGLVTVHLSEKNSTVFSVPFDKITEFCKKANEKDVDLINTDIVPVSKVKMLTASLESIKPIDLSLKAIRYEEESEIGVKR